jgi:four helix bundle protein
VSTLAPTLPPMRSFQHFTAWRACQRFAVAVHAATRECPPYRHGGLAERARRAAFNAAIALADGSAKSERRSMRRSLDGCLGALAECLGLLVKARDRGLIDVATFESLDERRDEVGKLVWGLYHRVGGSVGVH